MSVKEIPVIVEFTTFNKSSNWVKGKALQGNTEYTFEAKLYDTGSIFGINEGRVSKLWITQKELGDIVAYERGWDKKPAEIVRNVYDAVMKKLELSPKRWA